MAARAVITSVPGLSLSAEARAFLRDSDPWRVILFRYNIDTPAQVHALVAQCRDAVGRNAPVLVDQEGGRVQRIGPPHWPKYPPGAGRIAHSLFRLGLDVDCRRIADVPVSEADPVIGDRAYGTRADKVAAIG